MKHFVRSPYNYNRAAASIATGTSNTLPSLTIKSEREETDINVMLRRFGVTGQLPVVTPPPSLDAFDEVFDFQSAMNIIRASEESFNSLDAEVRSRFSNDPHRFVNFCSDPVNLPEMRKMGLAVPEPPVILPPEPQKVQIVNPDALPVKGST